MGLEGFSVLFPNSSQFSACMPRQIYNAYFAYF